MVIARGEVPDEAVAGSTTKPPNDFDDRAGLEVRKAGLALLIGMRGI
jgi:hypothetical protein